MAVNSRDGKYLVSSVDFRGFHPNPSLAFRHPVHPALRLLDVLLRQLRKLYGSLLEEVDEVVEVVAAGNGGDVEEQQTHHVKGMSRPLRCQERGIDSGETPTGHAAPHLVAGRSSIRFVGPRC